MALKFVKELPAGVTKKKNSSSVFTDDMEAELREHPNEWAHVEKGSAQGAAAFIKRIEDRNSDDKNKFQYASVDTGKPNGPKRKAPKGDGMFQPTLKEVYLRFNA